MCIHDKCDLLTLKAVWDEFNREHDGPTTADGVWIQINLWCEVKSWKQKGRKRKKKEKARRREAEVWKQEKIKVT